MTNIKCPVCGSSDLEMVEQMKNITEKYKEKCKRVIHQNDVVLQNGILKCKKCGHMYTVGD